VVATTGDYEFDFYVAGDHQTSGTTPLAFAIFIGGVSAGTNYEFVGDQGNNAAQVCVGHGIIHLTAGDNVTLRNRTNTGGGGESVNVSNPAGVGADADSSNRMFSLSRVG